MTTFTYLDHDDYTKCGYGTDMYLLHFIPNNFSGLIIGLKYSLQETTWLRMRMYTDSDVSKGKLQSSLDACYK